MVGGPGGAIGGAFLGAVFGVVVGAGYMIVGPFYGAATAESPASIEEKEAQLKGALVAMRVQETMRDHVVKTGQSLGNVDMRILEGQGPETASDLLTYFPLDTSQLSSILELRVTKVWLRIGSFKWPDQRESPSVPQSVAVLKINPPLSLGMEVRGRLIRTADKAVLYDNTWKREGEAHLLAEWAANDAQLFGEEFERAYDVLAGQMVTTIF